MSVEKSFNITLKLAVSDDGVFKSVRILKGRSGLPDDVLNQINKVLSESLVPSQPSIATTAFDEQTEIVQQGTIASIDDESDRQVRPLFIQGAKTTVAIGDQAEQKVMNHLLSISQMNSDFSVIDTSSETGHGDIAVIHQSKRICIEVKCYTKPVPMKEIDKYHKSLELSEYDAGIMIQMNACGYAAAAAFKSPIDFKIHEGKPSFYLTGIDLQMLYPIINMAIINIDNNNHIDEAELESKRKALLAVYEKISSLRACIDCQKKSISKMEAIVEGLAHLSSN